MPPRSTLVVVWLALAFALPANAQSQGVPPAAPKAETQPGSFRLNLRLPEPSRWIAQRDTKAPRTIYTCKPLACPQSLRVSVAIERSPNRNPNSQTLEKFAKADRAASAAREISDGAEKIENLVSETATYHGYPAVKNLAKYSRANAVVFKATTLIFAGPALVRIETDSPNESLVKETTEAFIAGMKFEDGPPSAKKPSGNTI